MIGLDSTALIDFVNGDKKIEKILTEITVPLCSTRLNYAELLFGLDSNKDCRDEEQLYEKLFKTLLTFELSTDSCKKAREIYWILRKKGKKIDSFDCLIAGILMAQGINTIITRNVKHFSLIPGLKVISY